MWLVLQDRQDEKSRAWNERRRDALKHCMERILYPMFAKELRDKLLDEARGHALKVRARS